MSSRDSFDTLIERNEFTVAPGVFHPMGAKISELTGHELIYISTGSINSGIFGLPDGTIGLSDLVPIVKRIKRCIDIPVIVDVDTGFGGPEHLKRTVQNFSGLDVDAIHIEDQKFPKKCGQQPGKLVVEQEEAMERYRTALNETDNINSNMRIIARIDAFDAVNGGWEEGIERTKMVSELGIDYVFPEMTSPSPSQVEEYANKILDLDDPPRLIFNYSAMHKWSQRDNALTFEELQEMGYDCIILPLFNYHVEMYSLYENLLSLGNDGEKAQFDLERKWESHPALNPVTDPSYDKLFNN